MALFKTSDSLVNAASGTPIDKNSVVTQLADGRYVVSWVISNGGTESVNAQIYNADGTTAGAAITPLAGTGNSASFPAVAALNNGGFVLAWQTGSGTNRDIMYNYVQPDGTPSGTNSFITGATTGSTYEWSPTMTTLANGNVVSTWVDQAGNVGMSLISFDSNTGTFGTPVLSTVATASAVASTSQSDAQRTQVATMADGRFVVQWESSAGDVLAKIYAPDGTVDPVGTLTVSAVATGNSDNQVTGLAAGGFISTWTKGNDVFAQIFSDTGAKSGAAITIASGTAVQNHADVAQLADGRLAFVWTSDEGGTKDIMLQMYTAAGVAMGGAFVVNTATTGIQDLASIRALADGRFVITWTDSNTTEVMQTTYDPANWTGTSGNDTWSGGDASDRLYGFAGVDKLSGNDGADFISGGDGDDSGLGGLFGGAGNDTIYGDAGNDKLDGGDGNDKLFGGEGLDTISGGTGNDTIEGGDGGGAATRETLDGGIGTDTISYFSSNAAVQINLAILSAAGGHATYDTIKGFENIIGSVAFGDTLTGDFQNNVIRGLGGNDNLSGGLGGDTLIGGDGNDTLTGGAGADVINGGNGNDIIDGGDGIDFIYVGLGNDTNIKGGAGIDTLSYQFEVAGANFALDNSSILAGGSAVGDTVNTTAGNEIENLFGSNTGGDTLYGNALANNLRGYGGNDSLFGLAGNDKLEGGDGDDTLTGGADADTLIGGNGNDTLVGGTEVDNIDGGVGNDIITGGAGVDKVYGGSGSDTFVFNALNELGDTMTFYDKYVSVSNIGDVFKFKSTVFGNLTVATYDAVENFWSNATGDAHDTTDRFIYDTVTDKLWYDSDGTGSAAKVLVMDFGNTGNIINGLQITFDV